MHYWPDSGARLSTIHLIIKDLPRPDPRGPAEGERPDVMDDTLPSRNDTPVRQAILDFAAEAGESFRDI